MHGIVTRQLDIKKVDLSISLQPISCVLFLSVLFGRIAVEYKSDACRLSSRSSAHARMRARYTSGSKIDLQQRSRALLWPEGPWIKLRRLWVLERRSTDGTPLFPVTYVLRIYCMYSFTIVGVRTSVRIHRPIHARCGHICGHVGGSMRDTGMICVPVHIVSRTGYTKIWQDRILIE